MALARRYQPDKAPNEACTIGLDFSLILPPGIGLSSASVACFTNTNPATASTDLTFGTVTTRGRLAWCTVSGGVSGTDYQVRWQATDSVGNTWPRTVVWLCAQTA